MRITTAWAKTAAENVTLKVATITLTIVTVVQLLIIGKLTSQDLAVIERGCYSRPLKAKKQDPTKTETEAFLIEALAMRFDSSGYLKEGFLSMEETIFREKELAILKQRQITQKILITDVKINNQNITVFADRILSVGKIKSVLSFHLSAKIQQSNRTESNPYGLILTSLSPLEEKEEK